MTKCLPIHLTAIHDKRQIVEIRYFCLSSLVNIGLKDKMCLDRQAQRVTVHLQNSLHHDFKTGGCHVMAASLSLVSKLLQASLSFSALM